MLENQFKSSWSTVGLSHSLDGIFVGSDVHDRDTGYFSDSPFQILITSSNNKYPVLFDSFYNTVICICSFMITFQSLESGILCDFKCNSIFNPKLLKLSNNTVRYIRNTFAKKTIHGSLENIKFILNREVNKISIQKYSIRWP